MGYRKYEDLISVIVPIYNVEKYLERCIKSIMAQSYANIEIILVNDGSTDNSLAICKKYQELDIRIKVIDKSNGGVSDARNTGIKAASGSYLVFVDSDDYVHYQMVELLYIAIIENDVAISVCNYVNVKENEKVQQEGYQVNQVISELRVLDSKLNMKEFYTENRIVYTVAWNKMYRRDLFDDILYPIGKIHEDEFTTYKLLYNAKKFALVDKTLYYYVQRRESIMSSQFSEERFYQIEANKERLDFFIQERSYEELAAKWYLWLYQTYLIQYKKTYPCNYKRYKEYENDFKQDIRKYKKYIHFKVYIKIWLKMKNPEAYMKIKKIVVR